MDDIKKDLNEAIDFINGKCHLCKSPLIDKTTKDKYIVQCSKCSVIITFDKDKWDRK